MLVVHSWNLFDFCKLVVVNFSGFWMVAANSWWLCGLLAPCQLGLLQHQGVEGPNPKICTASTLRT